MAFNLFKKKKEVVDLTGSVSGGIPIEGYMKRKGGASQQADSISSASSTGSGSSGSSSSGGGFFGGFFGGGSSSADSSASPASSSSAAPAQSMQTDFWGNPVNTNTSSSAPSSASSGSDSQISDILYRLSNMSDRIELIEKKIDRAERKLGISGSE